MDVQVEFRQSEAEGYVRGKPKKREPSPEGTTDKATDEPKDFCYSRANPIIPEIEGGGRSPAKFPSGKPKWRM